MIYRGDQREITAEITENSQPIDINSVEKIQFIFGDGDFIYYYPGENVSYDETTEKFTVLLKQEDTFSQSSFIAFQIRVKYRNSMIFATETKTVNIGNTLGKEVF